MAIIARITIGDVQHLQVDADPTTSGGTTAPIGSLASRDDNGELWLKTGAGDTAWTQTAVAVGVVAVGHRVILRPSGVASGNVYTTWATAAAAAQAIDEGPVLFILDDSANGGAAIGPTVNTDMSNMIIVGLPGRIGSDRVSLDLPTSISMDGALGLKDLILVPGGAASAPNFTIDPSIDGQNFFLVENCEIPTPTGSLIQYDGSGSGIVEFRNCVLLSPTASSILLKIAGPTCEIRLTEGTSSADKVFASGDANLTIYYDSNCLEVVETGNNTIWVKRSNSLRALYDPTFAPSGLTATTVQEAIDELASGGSVREPVAFVYEPGGTAGGNVYTDWNLLIAAIGAVEGRKTLQISNDSNTPASAGTAIGPFAFDDVELTGKYSAVRGFTAKEIFQNGSFGTQFSAIAKISHLEWRSSVISAGRESLKTGGSDRVLHLEHSVIGAQTPSTIATILVETGDTYDIYMNASRLGKTTGARTVELVGTGTLNVFLSKNSIIDADSFEGPVGSTINLIFQDGTSTASLTQTLFLGTLTVSYASVHRTITAHTVDATLTEAQSGSLNTNRSAVATVTLTLPVTTALLIGTTYFFRRLATFAFRIDPQAADTLRYSGGAMSAGEYLELGADESGCQVTWDGTEWLVDAEVGTITEETP